MKCERIQEMLRGAAQALMVLVCCACASGAQQSARELAGRIVPEYQDRISFREVAAKRDFYEISPRSNGILIQGNNANSLAAGLGRYLEEAGIDVSWYASQKVEVPARMPLPKEPIRVEALVPQRFFLNYCTFGYSMVWWQWEEWERLIDWMALHGVNLPLAITGQEAVWQKVWKKYGLSDDAVRAFFTGPAHLPWHRMCNIDGVDGPLPQGWIDGQEALQRQILRRERELGMKPVLPAFSGHVPAGLAKEYPNAAITPVSLWGGFPEENRCYFLSPADSLYACIQKDFLEEQTRRFGTDHIYGFDLFNEVDAPSWDPETLAAVARSAYESVAAVDPDAQWLQMGWLFHYDRKHWTPENIKAYLQAVPQGKVTLLDYYTEHTPVWKNTESFYGQPFIFCYLGNFGGNTRLSGPFRRESERISEALGKAAGIGCTLEGLGLNRWMYEYTLSRAWDTGISDDEWLSGLDRRHHSPEGFWKAMADSIYIRGSASEGVLMCDRPTAEGAHSWRVAHTTPYDPAVLERAFRRLLEHGGSSVIWRADVAQIGSQVLGNRFPALRDRFTAACRAGRKEEAQVIGQQMLELMDRADALCATHPEMRMDRWLQAAGRWAATPEEAYYYRHNAWHLLTTWGSSERLSDYANRLWSGLTGQYYKRRWQLFIDQMLAGKFEQKAFDAACWELEKRMVADAPFLEEKPLTLISYNVGAFGKYHDSLPEVAQLLQEQGADYVALQELDSCNRRHNSFQLEALAASLGFDGHFARAFPFADGAYGNGVVSRKDILKRFTVPLPQLDGYEPRSVAVVETEELVFASVHLDVREAKVQQAAIVNNWFTAHYAGCSKPVLLCGDMNARPGSPAVAELEKCWTRLSGLEDTYSTENPHGCIDYIFALKAAAPVRALSARVLTAGTATLSDHFPIAVTVSR